MFLMSVDTPTYPGSSTSLGVCTDIRNMWDFHLQNHQHFDTFVKDFKEKRLKIKLKYEHKISHVSYVRAHPNLSCSGGGRAGRD